MKTLFENKRLKVTDQNISNLDRIILLETFYRIVLRKEVSLMDIIFLEHEATGRMVHIPDLNYNEMMKNIAIYFGCKESRYKKTIM